MTDEYTESKIRVYLPKKKKDGGKFERYLVNPVSRAIGIGDKKKDRLTA